MWQGSVWRDKVGFCVAVESRWCFVSQGLVLRGMVRLLWIGEARYGAFRTGSLSHGSRG